MKKGFVGTFEALAYRVTCIDHPRMPHWIDIKKFDFYVKHERLLGHRDDRMEIAIGVAQKIGVQYGGNWIAEVPQPPVHSRVEWEGTLADRRKQAEENILAGPDCAGKRWLQSKKPPLLKTLPPRVNDGDAKKKALAELDAIPF